MSVASRRVKTKIKPPKKHDQDTSINETWTQLSRAICEIHNHNASNLSFEENYRFAYNLVLHKHGDMLYKGVKSLVAENIDRLAENEVHPAFPERVSRDPAHQSQEGERLLKALRKVWDDHTGSMSKLRDILKYMDRVYTPSASVPVIWDAGLKIFHDHMITTAIRSHINEAILGQIQVEREGYAINRSAVKSCVDVLLQLNDGTDGQPISVYKNDLEPEVLKESDAFYQLEAQNLLESCDAPEYLRRVESRFSSEENRAHHYLSSQTAAPLKKILEDTLLAPHLNTILSMPNSGLDAMIDEEKENDLARLYRLFIMIPTGLPALRKALKVSVQRRGQEINAAAVQETEEAREQEHDADMDPKGKGKAKARPPRVQAVDVATSWVQSVLTLKDKFDRLWRSSFASDRDVETSLNEAFSSFINLNKRASEFISLFIDENLKKGLKGKTDQEMDAVLDKTIVVFRYVADKDIFERYYKNHLAKRLLYGRSVSDDAERGMLAKLKVECGYQFTQKLEGMFNDIKISADHMAAYSAKLTEDTSPELNISVTIMTSTFWPMNHPDSTCNLPEMMIKACKSFEAFYLSRHSGRRLTWQAGLGSADVRATFRAKKHDLNISTFALVILLLFEDLPEGEFLTYEEIAESTNLAQGELKRNLQSLACAKYKILKKHPPSRDVNVEDSFSFNHDFSAPLQRIKISTVSAKVESTEERKETENRIEEDRHHQAEACIVRIMKNRKHMTHNDLVNEVTRQLVGRFQPNPLTIKRRIESLIERDYLERCADRKSYNYLCNLDSCIPHLSSNIQYVH
ncbi:Cullin-domain-containing protein [Rickenella mellea]|uniref:Cullin-domain-containing protein n=1 Tax=Rickenella mellea TaxID=50990 RepID=A0A4Y7QDU0_9AGAM|nr:Cullin-domain-containing protein [Rickenella mellea]